MSVNPLTPDLQAVGDVLLWVAEQAEDMDLETAIVTSEALGELVTLIGKTRALLDARAKKLLDGQPAKIGDKVYMEKADGKWRPEQGRIRKVMVTRAAYDEAGVERPGHVAAGLAVDLAYKMFVAPSAMPKQGAMRELGIEAKDVATWERTGSHLEVIATEKADN